MKRKATAHSDAGRNRQRRRRSAVNLGQRGPMVPAWLPKPLSKESPEIVRRLQERIYNDVIRTARIVHRKEGFDAESFWDKAVPTALLLVLRRFDSTSSCKAACGFFQITYGGFPE